MSIELILGNMFAGKSSRLLTRLRRYEIAKKKCIYVKFRHDCRYEKNEEKSKQEVSKHPSLESQREIVTHRGDREKAISCECLSEIMNILIHYDVIGIDEVQFFRPQTVDCMNELANKGKIIVASGLNGTKTQCIWPNVAALIPWSERITHETAICDSCGDECHLTVGVSTSNKHSKKPQKEKGEEEGEQTKTEIDIGGAEKYAPRCRRCALVL